MGALRIEDLPHYTYNDYKNWKDKWELIYGISYCMSPMPLIKHQKISNKIARFLDEALKNCKQCSALLPIDWKISDDTIVQPDNLVICHQPTNEAYITQAPKIIFEILSKSTANKDINIKYNLYEKEGVRYYIIVNPDETVAKVYHLKNGRYIKMCDTVNNVVKFEIDECMIEFDFSKIW